MRILDIRDDMARIQQELERELGPSLYLDMYLRYIEELKTVLPNIESRTEHHVLPRSVFPQFENLVNHPWNRVITTLPHHFAAHALLVVSYPAEPRFSDALKAVFHTTTQGTPQKKIAQILRLAKVKNNQATVGSKTIGKRSRVNYKTVSRVLRKVGIQPLPRLEAYKLARGITPSVEKKVLRLAKVQDGKLTVPINVIARATKISNPTVARILKEKGVAILTIKEARRISAGSVTRKKKIIQLSKPKNGKATVSAAVVPVSSVSRVAS